MNYKYQWVLAMATAMALVAACVGPIAAASSFATPAFQAQWQQGESITPNFWGPLATAGPAQQEPYQEASGGNRLVQYFDKGRMELTNGAVTNGLLATDLVKGQLQVGNNAFQKKDPPNIPIAGDPDNPGPTYATLATTGARLLEPRTQYSAAAYVYSFSERGELIPNPKLGLVTVEPPYAITTYDTTTQHNVIDAFAAYRNRAGLAAIGYAISEPFRAAVKVGGTPRLVGIQIFERRVLTYTAENPAAFQVEMGNIGAHYYQWRYGQPLTSVQRVQSAGVSGPAPAAVPQGTSSTGSSDSEEADMLARINAYRQQNGLNPLAVSPTLTQAAKWMSADMAAKRYFDHTDSQGRDPFQRMCAFGYCANTWKAENIAAGNGQATATFEQWRTSAGHNANMLDPNAVVIGIGRAQGGAGDPYSWYWTTDFGGV